MTVSAYINPAEGPPMLRESIATSIGRSSARSAVSKATPTIGAPSRSGWAPSVISTSSSSSPRVPVR